MTKNWLEEVPSTDEEVTDCLQSLHGKNSLYASSMLGIYRIYRKRGCTVLDAYEEALRASLSNTLHGMLRKVYLSPMGITVILVRPWLANAGDVVFQDAWR